MPNWYLMQTRVGGEKIAEVSLTTVYKSAVYFPKILIQYGRNHALPRLFLPRFGFVNEEGVDSVERVRNAPGISRLVTSETKLARVPQPMIDSIRCREVDGYIPVPKSLRRIDVFEEGDIIRIFEGKFKGRNGKFERWDGKRAAVAVEMFNRAVTVRLNPAFIRRIEL